MKRAVSFVCTVYNKARYLPAVLEGIASQIGIHEAEYIFVDDGSTDDSLALLQETTRHWSNVKIISQTNAGVAAATNRGFAEASLPYVKLVDADDILFKNATLLLLHALEETGAVASFGQNVCAGLPMPSDSMQEQQRPVSIELLRSPLRIAIRKNLFTPSVSLMRKAAIERCGGCDIRVGVQDTTLILRLAKEGDFVAIANPVCVVPQYGLDRTRVSTNHRKMVVEGNRALAYFLEDNPDLPKALQNYAARRVVARTIKYLRRNDLPVIKRLKLYPALWKATLGMLPDPGKHVWQSIRTIETLGDS